MTETIAPTVGDVHRIDEEWCFGFRYGRDEMLLFDFKTRAEANVSRRLMKEIIARTARVRSMRES